MSELDLDKVKEEKDEDSTNTRSKVPQMSKGKGFPNIPLLDLDNIQESNNPPKAPNADRRKFDFGDVSGLDEADEQSPSQAINTGSTNAMNRELEESDEQGREQRDERTFDQRYDIPDFSEPDFSVTEPSVFDKSDPSNPSVRPDIVQPSHASSEEIVQEQEQVSIETAPESLESEDDTKREESSCGKSEQQSSSSSEKSDSEPTTQVPYVVPLATVEHETVEDETIANEIVKISMEDADGSTSNSESQTAQISPDNAKLQSQNARIVSKRPMGNAIVHKPRKREELKLLDKLVSELSATEMDLVKKLQAEAALPPDLQECTLGNNCVSGGIVWLMLMQIVTTAATGSLIVYTTLRK